MLSGGRSPVGKIPIIPVNPLDKLLVPQKIALNLIGEGVDHFTQLGYDQGYGVRPFNRTIHRKLENPLVTR